MQFNVYLIQCRADFNLQSLITKKFFIICGQVWLRGVSLLWSYLQVLPLSDPALTLLDAEPLSVMCLCLPIWVKTATLLCQDTLLCQLNKVNYLMLSLYL